MKLKLAVLAFSFLMLGQAAQAVETCAPAPDLRDAVTKAQAVSAAIANNDGFQVLLNSLPAAVSAEKAWGPALLAGWPDGPVAVLEEFRLLMRAVAAGDELRNEDGRRQVEAMIARAEAVLNEMCPEY